MAAITEAEEGKPMTRQHMVSCPPVVDACLASVFARQSVAPSGIAMIKCSIRLVCS